jgi:hypothetical protein
VPAGVVAENCPDMGSPQVERLPTFREELVSLIYGRDPRDRAGLMVEDFIGDVRWDANAGHPGYTGAPQIVKTPVLYT